MKGKRRAGFNQYLRQQRLRRGFDLAQAATNARMPLPRLILLESGAASPARQEIRALARARDLPADVLMSKAGL